jgi:hypothetical protein
MGEGVPWRRREMGRRSFGRGLGKLFLPVSACFGFNSRLGQPVLTGLPGALAASIHFPNAGKVRNLSAGGRNIANRRASGCAVIAQVLSAGGDTGLSGKASAQNTPGMW